MDKKKKNIIIATVIVVVLMIVGVLGYGLYNGAKVRDYAKSVQTMMNDSSSKWTQQQLSDSSLTPNAMRTKLLVVQSDSEAQLQKLAALAVPSQAQTLAAQAKEYFTTAKTVSTNLLALVDYTIVLQAVNTDLQSTGSASASSMQEIASSFMALHLKLASNIQKLKAATPPAGAYQTYNTQFVAMLEDFDNQITNIATYAQQNQLDKLEQSIQALSNTTSNITKLSAPSDTDAMNSILTDAIKTRLNNLPNAINTEINDLSKTVVSY